MKKVAKVILFVFVIIYIVSPIDACPGPIDDALLLVITIAATRKSKRKAIEE